jgi:hypothetical protein
MSTAQVTNAGISSGPTRVARRYPVEANFDPVEPVIGSYAAPARDQTPRYADDGQEFDNRRRNSSYGPFQDRVVSFGGVLVSQEVGTAVMHAQSAAASRGTLPVAVEAERSVAAYEFNQALMDKAHVLTSIGLSR